METLETAKRWAGCDLLWQRVGGSGMAQGRGENSNRRELRPCFEFVLLCLVMKILSSLYTRSSPIIFYSNYNGLLFYNFNLRL